MSDSTSDAELARLAADLARSLRDLQRELEPRSRRRGFVLPSPRTLLRLADEVAIPAAILVLETNVRALKLLQRAVRLANDGEEAARSSTDSAVRDRAVALSRTTLDRLDDVLEDVQGAVEGRPNDREAGEVLEEARSLREELDAKLAGPDEAVGDREVPVDVDAELSSIRDEIDGEDDGQ